MKDERRAVFTSSFRLHPSRRGEQFGVENGRARRAAHGVVTERDEAVVEYVVGPDAPDGDTHAAAGITVEFRLRAVLLVADDDGSLRRGMEFQFLRKGSERSERVADFADVGLARELDADGGQVAVGDVDAVNLRAHGERRRLDAPVAEATENLLRLALDLLLLA